MNYIMVQIKSLFLLLLYKGTFAVKIGILNVIEFITSIFIFFKILSLFEFNIFQKKYLFIYALYLCIKLIRMHANLVQSFNVKMFIYA